MNQLMLSFAYSLLASVNELRGLVMRCGYIQFQAPQLALGAFLHLLEVAPNVLDTGYFALHRLTTLGVI